MTLEPGYEAKADQADRGSEKHCKPLPQPRRGPGLLFQSLLAFRGEGLCLLQFELSSLLSFLLLVISLAFALLAVKEEQR